uniref:Secreted protein n=1 Tax=Hordeum vulgare subsp. vulgare TaxID=112509 RepID=A0A8I6X2M4_HORVV
MPHYATHGLQQLGCCLFTFLHARTRAFLVAMAARRGGCSPSAQAQLWWITAKWVGYETAPWWWTKKLILLQEGD